MWYPDRVSLIHNEQTKLLAGALDRASTACFTVGVAAPAAAAIYTRSTVLDILTFALAAAVWLTAAVVLRLIARSILKGLRS